jgi:hypothetical protein
MLSGLSNSLCYAATQAACSSSYCDYDHNDQIVYVLNGNMPFPVQYQNLVDVGGLCSDSTFQQTYLQLYIGALACRECIRKQV